MNLTRKGGPRSFPRFNKNAVHSFVNLISELCWFFSQEDHAIFQLPRNFRSCAVINLAARNKNISSLTVYLSFHYFLSLISSNISKQYYLIEIARYNLIKTKSYFSFFFKLLQLQVYLFPGVKYKILKCNLDVNKWQTNSLQAAWMPVIIFIIIGHVVICYSKHSGHQRMSYPFSVATFKPSLSGIYFRPSGCSEASVSADRLLLLLYQLTQQESCKLLSI